MAIETEKKYRLDGDTRRRVEAALREVGAEYVGRDLEENIIYTGEILQRIGGVIRLRHVGERTLLTFKRRMPNDSDVKEQIEHETEASDARSVSGILAELSLEPAVIYEKRRDTWKLDDVEVVLDELPFGEFMEIEGEPAAIRRAEAKLGIEELPAVAETYPGLTRQLGQRNGTAIEARFRDP